MKTFAVYVKSESGDGWLFAFKAKKKPKTDAEWLPILQEHLPDETEMLEDAGVAGIAGTWLHIEDCIEVK